MGPSAFSPPPSRQPPQCLYRLHREREITWRLISVVTSIFVEEEGRRTHQRQRPDKCPVFPRSEDGCHNRESAAASRPGVQSCHSARRKRSWIAAMENTSAWMVSFAVSAVTYGRRFAKEEMPPGKISCLIIYWQCLWLQRATDAFIYVCVLACVYV